MGEAGQPLRDLLKVSLEATTRLSADPASAQSARNFLATSLGRWRCDAAVDLVVLLANELVTNAILHARSGVRLTLRLTPARLRVEVTDSGGGPPELTEPHLEATSGRGLSMVDTAAQAWGVESVDGGKRVWFEVPA